MPERSEHADGAAGPGVGYRPVPAMFDRDAHPTEFNRVLALSDGVFAIALTLLVLDLALPLTATDGSLREDLAGRQAHFISFAVSLLLVGSSWVSHHRLFTLLQGVTGTTLTLNILYLGFVVLIPFAQSVLAGYLHDPFAYVLFAAIIATIGIIDAIVFVTADRGGLLRSPLSPRYRRIELLRNGVLVGTFLISMPLAFLLGPYTILVWFSLFPADRLLSWWQDSEVPPALIEASESTC